MDVSLREALTLSIAKLPSSVRFRAQNATLGFEKALALFPIDREMASFRAITAEEEAAAALFASLKLCRYPGSQALSYHDHRHKAAVRPFLQAVQSALSDGSFANLQLTVDWSKPSLSVRIPLSQVGVAFEGSDDLALELVEPLDVLAKRGADAHPANFFDASLNSLMQHHGANSLAQMVAKEANARNTLLYASDSRLPASKATVEGIEWRRDRAEIALYLCIAILQTRKHQQFVKQCLDAFLRLVDKLPAEQIQYDDVKVEISIHAKRAGGAEVRFFDPPQWVAVVRDPQDKP